MCLLFDLSRPAVWFGLRVLKAVQLMEVPLLKLWIHHAVMDGIVNALVDPGKLDICGRRGTDVCSVMKTASHTPNGILDPYIFGRMESWLIFQALNIHYSFISLRIIINIIWALCSSCSMHTQVF